MIFASVDYARYRSGRGRYTEPSMVEHGWLRATATNVSRLEQAAVPGQIFFLHRRRSLVAFGIMFVDNQTLANHCGVMLAGGNVVEALTRGGVVQRPFSVYADDTSYLCVAATQLSADQSARVAAAAAQRHGTPYGWSAVARIGLAQLTGLDRYASANVRLIADTSLTLFALTLLVTNVLTSLLVVGCHLALVTAGCIRRRRRPLARPRIPTPGQLFEQFKRRGEL